MEKIIRQVNNMNYLKHLFIFSFLISFGCSGREEVDQSYYYEEPNISREDYIRDSLFITHVSNEYFRLGIDGFYISNKREYERFLKENDKSLIFRFVPVRTFYNETATKLYSYVIMGVALGDTAKWPEDFDHFSAYNLMGFRESKCNIWKLYPYYRIVLFGAPTLDTIIHDLNTFYFRDLKNSFSELNHNPDGNMKQLKHNLNDPGFWENYPDLVLGTTYVDSLYAFQFNSNKAYDENFVEKGFDYYLDQIDFAKYYKYANSNLKQRSIEWQLYLWRNKLQDTSITYEQIRFKKDSLNLEIIRKYINVNITMQDVINKGMDYYTYKPKIDSVIYPEYLLKMYECK